MANPSYRVEFTEGENLTARLLREGKVVGRSKKGKCYAYPFAYVYEWGWGDNPRMRVQLVRYNVLVDGVKPPQKFRLTVNWEEVDAEGVFVVK